MGPASEADEFGGVAAVATISAFRAALQTAKSSTCLIVNLSADLEIIPVVEGPFSLVYILNFAFLHA